MIRDIKRGVTSNFDGDLADPLRRFIVATVGQAGRGDTYRDAYQRLEGALVEILADHGNTDYLMPLVQMGTNSDWTLIATLNYDLTVESTARSAGVPLNTGVGTWAEFGSWRWPDAGIRLLKLHGSIDWKESVEYHEHALAVRRIDVVGENERLKSPAVIFGGRSKLRPDGPFLELLAQFEVMLADALALVVVGYSFRDAHVNEVIRRWINGSDHTRLVVIDPAWPARVRDQQSFRYELELRLTGRGPREAVAPRPGVDGRPFMPEVAARLRVLRGGAALMLAEAVRLASGTDSVWPSQND